MTYNTLATAINSATTQAKALPEACKTQDLYASMSKAQGVAQTVLHSVQDTQLSLSQLLFRARLAAHDGLQAQLEAQRPSQDAFLAAGKSMLAAASTLAPASLPAPATSDAVAVQGGRKAQEKEPKPAAPECSADDLKKISQLQATFDGVKQSLLDGVVNAVADAGKDCLTASPTLVSQLTVSQTTVPLHAGENGIVVVVSGGRPPLTANWVNTLPNDSEAKYSWLVANQQILLYAPATAVGGKTYTLQVRDSAARPASLDITVTTAK
ncbi:hypothetical protein [Ralstonia pseudosolanacearum]